MTAGARRAPLLLTTALLALLTTGPAGATAHLDDRWGDRVPRVPGQNTRPAQVPDGAAWVRVPKGVAGVRVPSGRTPKGVAGVPVPSGREPVRPVPPKGVTVGPTVKVPKVTVRRSPGPRVSIAVPGGKRRVAPPITSTTAVAFRAR